ncbi:MAG TPA: hypothetical protein VG015_06270, partial [Candidatus Dormibacteraeota bacterium]|nr:hypothetical protein [Candidatus Dormibacteraeota bacterium]
MPKLIRPLLAVLVLLFLTSGAISLRSGTSPTLGGYRPTLTSGLDGGIYAVHYRDLVAIDRGGHASRVGGVPPGTALAMVSVGADLILGTEHGIYRWTSSGQQWSPLPGLPMAKFSALADQGQFIIASAWSVGIWVSNDAGLSWTRA